MAQNIYRFGGNLHHVYRRLLSLKVNTNIFVTQVRWRQRHLKPYFQVLHHRREVQGPEPERHRSVWINWNYDSEIFAFGQRLHEDFEDSTLRRIFTHRSHIEQEREALEKLDDADKPSLLPVDDNTEFINNGEELCTSYIKAYLRHSYPALPEEGICSVRDYLMTTEMLADIGCKLGVKDLIICAEFPVSTETLRDSLLAVIGGLSHDKGGEHAGLFVQDFILTMLVGKDIMEMWPLVNPMGVLQAIVVQQQQGEVEARLLYETGSSTVLAVYMVGVYSDKKLLGKGYGETLSIAEEMAARDALRHFFGTTIQQKPLPFGSDGHTLDIDLTKVNNSVKDFLTPNQLQ